MGSKDPGGNDIKYQMEQEMDELQQMHYSTEFSTDINSKMQVTKTNKIQTVCPPFNFQVLMTLNLFCI